MFKTQLMLAGAGLLALALVGGTAEMLANQRVGAGRNEPQEAADNSPANSKPDSAAEAAARQRSINNLKCIMLAMYGYHDVHGSFPPAAIYDQNGKALLSWRVMLLPSLDYATKRTNGEALYKKFKLDEPWDSEHNKKLLAEMPEEYAPVRGTTQERYSTYYQGFTGKNTLFEGKRGVRHADILDFTRNTIAIVEGAKAVPWTKPVDLPYEENKPLPELGGLFPDVIHAGFSDGVARTLRRDFDEKTMRLAITYNDGQAIDPIGLQAKGLRVGDKIHLGLAYREPKNKPQTLDVFAPAEGTNHPVVIYIHGGGWHSGDKAEVRNKPTALTEQGFVLASINYRLWTPPWSKSFPGTVTLKQQAQDVAKAIRWLHDHARDYGGDPATLIVMGHSAGAHLAALVCTDDRYLKAEGLSLANINGCVPIDGDSFDLPMHMKANAGKKVAATDRERFGDENLQKELSPVMHVARGKSIPPFLILYILDPDHPETQAQAERFAQALRAAGVPVKTHGAAGKDHSTLNYDLGLPNDKPTQELFEFLSQVSRRP